MTMIFVYGTLRSDKSQHHLLGKSRLVGEAVSDQSFLLRHWSAASEPEGYPAAIEDNGPEADKLRGEIYEIDATTLNRLDHYEDYPHLYDRRLFSFTLANGNSMSAYLYCAPRPEA